MADMIKSTKPVHIPKITLFEIYVRSTSSASLLSCMRDFLALPFCFTHCLSKYFLIELARSYSPLSPQYFVSMGVSLRLILAFWQSIQCTDETQRRRDSLQVMKFLIRNIFIQSCFNTKKCLLGSFFDSPHKYSSALIFSTSSSVRTLISIRIKFSIF